MKNILILTFLLCVGQIAFAQQAEIEALERKRFAAQVSKDADFLEKILADDLIYNHSNGKTDNKTSYIAAIKDGTSVYKKIDLEEIKVRSYMKNTLALVNGVALMELGSADGKFNTVRLRYSVVYTKDSKKGWQLNNWQSTRVPMP